MRDPLALLRNSAVGEFSVSRDKIGISYSGGGPLVVLEFGVAMAFVKYGVVPAVISGVSAGALAGTAHALDPIGGRGIRMGMNILGEMSNHRFGLTLPQMIARWLEHQFHIQSLGDNAPLGKAIEHHLATHFGLRDVTMGYFKQAGLPALHVCATDRLNGHAIWFPDDVPLTEALLASTAIPGVFPWRKLRVSGVERILVDGGVVHNQPLSNLVLEGCGTIYACGVGWPDGLLPPPTSALTNAFPCVGMMMHEGMRMEADYVRTKLGGAGTIHEVRPHEAVAADGFDFTPALIEDLVEQVCGRTLKWLEAGAPDRGLEDVPGAG